MFFFLSHNPLLFSSSSQFSLFYFFHRPRPDIFVCLLSCQGTADIAPQTTPPHARTRHTKSNCDASCSHQISIISTTILNDGIARKEPIFDLSADLLAQDLRFHSCPKPACAGAIITAPGPVPSSPGAPCPHFACLPGLSCPVLSTPRFSFPFSSSKLDPARQLQHKAPEIKQKDHQDVSSLTLLPIKPIILITILITLA